jgi:hypothetical protein
VFNTAHQIYVIHDNGENCQGWPAWIPTGTKFPVSLFDPNSDRNYQFFCSGLYYKITAFNGQGRPLPYWNPKEVWPSIKSPIGNFYFKGNQVYWYLNEAGKLQFMNREAKPNIDIILDSTYKFNQVNITAIDTNEFIIRGLDSNELVKIKYTSGKKPVITKLAAAGFNSFSLVKNDQYKYDYLFQNDLQIVLQNEVGEVLLKKALTEPILEHVQYTSLGEGKKLIYVNKTNNTLHVEQTNGNVYPPFPMQINGRYAIGDLFNDADYWLIFSDNQNKLNLYKVK